MLELTSYSQVPAHFMLCTNNSCSKCQTCLRNMAWRLVPETEESLKILNPQRAKGDDTCQYYRDSTSVKYGKGFTNIDELMLPKQHSAFVSEMRQYFTRNPFYMRRRGEMLMPPSEQKIFYAALQHAGASEYLDFDAFEEQFNWFD